MKKYVYLLFAVFLSSCSSNSDDVSEDIFLGGGDQLTFRFNGQQRNALEEGAAASFTEVSFLDTTLFGFGIAGGFADLSGNTWTLVTAFTTTNPDFLAPGNTITSNNLGEDGSFSALYSQNLNSDEDLFDAENNGELFFSITISAIDLSSEQASGSFSFDLRDRESNEIYQIRNGTFTNLPINTNN